MPFKKISFAIFLFLFFFQTQISAQVTFQNNDLKKNKDISWIAETEFVYQLEHHDRMNFEPANSSQEETRTMKIDPRATCNFGNEKFFTNYILNAASEGKLRSFSADGRSLNTAEVADAMGSSLTDTVTTFDPVTLEETFAILRIDPIFRVHAFKIKQWWFYNKRNQTFHSMVRSVGPMLETFDKNGEPNGSRFLFWIDMEQDLTISHNINSPNVIWAKETINTLSFEKTKKIKGRTKKVLKDITYQDPKKGKTSVLENESWYAYCAKTISTDEVNKLLSASKDTIITYDPETLEEETEVSKNPKVKFKDFHYFRVHQHWFFDHSTNQLASEVITIAPLQDFLDKKGDLKYRRALYYIIGNPDGE